MKDLQLSGSHELINKTKHICYTVSTMDLIQIWIETFHMLDHVVVVHDGLTHIKLLDSLGFNLDQAKLFDNRVLTIKLESIDDALSVMGLIPITDGPYTQVFSLGKYITDNIET